MGSEVAGVKSYYTNAELYAQLKPDEMSSPYTYDNFDWPHCEVSKTQVLGLVWFRLTGGLACCLDRFELLGSLATLCCSHRSVPPPPNNGGREGRDIYPRDSSFK